MGELGQTDNIFVVYPSFTGGNHLSNLIGLCKNVEPTWLKDKELFKKYYLTTHSEHYGIDEGGMIAHHNIPGTTNANEKRLYNHKEQFIENVSNGYINILGGHNHSFRKLVHLYIHDQNHSDMFGGIDNIKWLMIEYPNDKNSLATKRQMIEKANISPVEDELILYPKLDNIYEWDFNDLAEDDADKISKVKEIYTMCPGTNAVSLDADVFFTKEGIEDVRSMLKGYFGLHLPSIANQIHSLWIQMIEMRVDYYNEHGK